jgi:hypothetical protein
MLYKKSLNYCKQAMCVHFYAIKMYIYVLMPDKLHTYAMNVIF